MHIMSQIIAQGAEAVLEKDDRVLIKNRIEKSYRMPEIDMKLRRSRAKLEANLLRKAKRIGILVPQVLEENEFSIKMEFIEGRKVKDILNKKNANYIMTEAGKAVALLHENDIIHGDLTTSNMILKHETSPEVRSTSFGDLYFIDFGLGFHSARLEDKAVDLHLFHEALESAHFDILEIAWKMFLGSYKKDYKEADKVIKTLLMIEKRGRYKRRQET